VVKAQTDVESDQEQSTPPGEFSKRQQLIKGGRPGARSVDDALGAVASAQGNLENRQRHLRTADGGQGMAQINNARAQVESPGSAPFGPGAGHVSKFAAPPRA